MASTLELAAESVGEQEWLDPVANTAGRMVEAALSTTGGAKTALTNCLHGTWLGHPLHPALTDVPLGSWTAALVMDALEASGRRELGPGADAAVAVGLVGAAAAAVTGLNDWRYTDGRARRIGMAHGLLNGTATLLYATSWLLRRRGSRGPARAAAGLGYALGMVSAYLGGHLVSGEQIGVDHSVDEQAPENWTPVMAEADLPEGTPVRGDAHGSRVLLVRLGGEIHALAETCSHLGGPLSEGSLEGDSIRCPWHGSRFCLRDGAVLEGPAAFPMPRYEVRVSQGQVEVRRPPSR